MDTLSAPALRIFFASSTVFIPPATQKGIERFLAISLTHFKDTVESFVLALIS